MIHPRRQFPPVEVSLPVGDVLLPLQAFVEVAALGPAASRFSPGNKRSVEGESIMSVITELLRLLPGP